MSDQIDMPAQEEPSNMGSAGEQLKQAREANNFSIEVVAEKLYLSKAQIIAIEENNFDYGPGGAYVRGYVRAYATLVGLDADALLTSIEHKWSDQRDLDRLAASKPSLTKPAAENYKEPPIHRFQGGRRPKRWRVIIAVVILIVAIFGVRRYESSPSTPTSQASTTSSTTPGTQTLPLTPQSPNNSTIKHTVPLPPQTIKPASSNTVGASAGTPSS